MASNPYRFIPSLGDRTYVVNVKETGVHLGSVRHWTERYNLTRLLVVHGWRAYPATPDGTYARALGHDDRGGRPHLYRTRAEAAEALADHYQEHQTNASA